MVLLLAAAALCGQDAALVRLKREAALVEASAKDKSKEPDVTALHRALREWIESRLPEDKGCCPLSLPPWSQHSRWN
jgi:hypothetical protein